MSQNLNDLQNVKFDVEISNCPDFHSVVRNGHVQVGQSTLSSMTNVYISPGLDGVVNTQLDRSDPSCRNKGPYPKNRFSNIEEGLESSLGDEAKERITRIVNDVKSLSDVEKLLLYLKLPSGDTASDELRQTPTSCLSVSNRIEQAQAFTWIKSHLEEDIEICLPKQEVYDDYKLYCENHGLKPLSTADFGKVMKCVFPNVKPRRLGQRGQSRYCYGGLRKKLDVGPPQLPELEIVSPRKQQQDQKDDDDELFSASCTLVCEWAQKLLGNNFSSVRDLAEFLVGNLYVNSKSVAAFTLIAGMQEAGIQNQKVSSLFSNTTGGDRHRETQLQLQRKLQERELVREQKRKLQQQKEENEQQIRMSLDRQTPVIFSPSLQQDSSPARRIFDDENARNSQNDPLDYQRSRSVVCVGSMSPPLPRSRRSKSLVGDVEMKIVNNSNRMDKSELEESMDTALTNKSIKMTMSDPEKVTGCVQTVNRSSSSSTEEMTAMEFGQNARTPKKSEKNDRLEHEIEASSLFHTVRKPSFVVLGSVNIPNNEIVPSSNYLTVVNSSPIKSNHSVLVAESSNKDMNLDACAENKNVLVSESLIKDNSNKDNSHFINPSTIPSRSAFVPFSQVQCRKDISDDMNTKIPSMSVTSGADITDPNSMQQMLLLGKGLDSNEQKILPSTNIYSDSSPGRPILVMKTVPSSISVSESQVTLEANNNNITCKPISCDTNMSVDQLKQSPGMTLTTLGLAGKQEGIVSATTSCSESQFSQPMTSPSKKAPRSRFTPIRPKASPSKTVSSILKEQKVLNSDAPAYDTRPVATLLKEKRAREAEAMNNKSKTVSQTISLTPTLQSSVMANFSNVSNNLNLSTLPAGKPGEFVIILNTNAFNQNALPSTSQNNMVTAVTTTTLSVTTSTCKSAVQTHTVSSLAQRTAIMRTNSSSERELDSPMPMSQDSLNTSDLSEGYTSATDEEKPSKMAKIVDSDQNVSSRPGSRCSPDRETPSFSGRKRKFYNVGGNFQSRKRINSVDDDDDDVIICDPKEFTKDQRRTRSCTFETDDTVGSTKNTELSSKDGSQYPDISSLESDALLDISDNVHLLSKTSSTKDSLTKQVHSTAVGVNALSLRQSQQQLLKQKQMLDERMKFFLHKDTDVGVGWVSDSGLVKKAPGVKVCLTEKEEQRHISLHFEEQNTNFKVSPIENQDNFENLSSSEMDVGEDIPPDVVDFITEKLTGISNTNVILPEKKMTSFEEHLTRPQSEEILVEVDFSESPIKIAQYPQNKEVDMVPLSQDLGSNNSNSQFLNENNKDNLNKFLRISSKVKSSTDQILTNNGQVIKQGLIGESETLESRGEVQSASNQIDPFVSPQTPARRQRTSSVEKVVNHSQQTFQRPRETTTEVHGKRTPSSDGGYSINQTQHAFTRPRESSFDSHGKQTPSSDAGYYSIGSSPVSHNTPVSSALTCENHALLTRNPSSLMVTRPDSAQSLSSDIIVPQSPIQQLSPRFHTSTPLLLRSPCPTPNQGCPTPNQGLLPSPTDMSGHHGQITEFMPIQGSSLKINSHVTLIKPVVTVASSQVQGQGHITQDLIGIGSIQPDVKESLESRSLPSYNAALQSKQRERMQSNIGKKGAFDTFKEAKLPTYVGTTSVLSSEGDVQKKGKNKFISDVASKNECSPAQNLLPFSNYMALLSRKAQEDKRSSQGEKGKQSEIFNDSNGNIFIETDVHHQKVTNSVTVQSERGTVNWTGINKLSAEAKSKTSSHSSQDKPNIESILSLLKSYENLSSSKTPTETTVSSNISTSFSPAMHFTTLPSSNYSGKAPNINLATILPTAKDKVINSETRTVTGVIDNDDVTFTARRNLTDLLQTNDVLNEDELQSTLDDLRSVDSQYFGQDDLEFDYSKRV